MSAALERAVEPLDGIRRASLRVAQRSALLRSWLARRDRRLAALATAHVAVAFLLAACFPVLLVVLGPLVLGVAHVGADLRYLVARRALPRAFRYLIYAACAGLVAWRAALEFAHRHGAARSELMAAFAWAFCALFIAVRTVAGRAARVRAGVAFTLLVGFGACAWCFPRAFELVLVHAHHLVALALWAWLFRGRHRPLLLPWSLSLLAALLLASGMLYRVPIAAGGLRAFGLHALTLADWLAPGAGLERALGIVSAYAFLQSVHYAVWLVFLPQEELPRETSATFRSSARSLVADLTPAGVVVLLAAAAALGVAGCFDPLRARAVYLSLVTFHTYLELVLAVYFFVTAYKFPCRR